MNYYTVLKSLIWLIIFIVSFGTKIYRTIKRNKRLDDFHQVINAKDYYSAMFYIDEYLLNHPKDAIAHSYRAVVLQNLNRDQEAEETLQLSIKLDKKNSFSRRLLGDLYQERNQLYPAIEQYKKSLKYEKAVLTYMHLGIAYYKLDETKMALKNLNKALKKTKKIDEQKTIYKYLTMGYIKLGQDKLSSKYKDMYNELANSSVN